MLTGPDLEGSASVGETCRLTGLSPALLRAWERRYGAVQPLRTPGGTRRYRPSDVARLQLLAAAVRSGHRISQIGSLGDAALRERITEAGGSGPVPEVLRAVEALDLAKAQHVLSSQLSLLGARGFARRIALPLLVQIGERWAQGRLGIASEHLCTALLRSLLGASLQPTPASLRGPRVVFATPPGERHELGVQLAALSALGAGANPIYLGPDLPLDSLIDATARSRAGAIALGLTAIHPAEAAHVLDALRAALPESVRIWVGGATALRLEPIAGIQVIGTLDALEEHVHALCARPRDAA